MGAIILGAESLGAVFSLPEVFVLATMIGVFSEDWPLAMRIIGVGSEDWSLAMRSGRGNGGWHRLLTSKLESHSLVSSEVSDSRCVKKSKSKEVQKSKCPNAQSPKCSN